MSDILVVGLAGRRPTDNWSALLGDRVVVARHGACASAALPAGTPIESTFDAVFESVMPPQIATAVSDAVCRVAEDRDVAYLTPGFGTVGDAIVEQLGSRRSLSLAPGFLSPHRSGACVTIVDSLELAAAESSEPFVGALPPLDAGAALLATNWHGTSVVHLATRRLSRSRVVAAALEPDDDGFVSIAAVDPLDARGSLAALEHVVARLRRDDGCPWDREQTAESLLPALAEEADELRLAIEAGDVENIVEEMGDVLGNLLMQAQIAAEAGQFHFVDAIAAIHSKLVRRHPHVFGDAHASTSDDVLTIWRQIKADEQAARTDAKTSFRPGA